MTGILIAIIAIESLVIFFLVRTKNTKINGLEKLKGSLADELTGNLEKINELEKDRDEKKEKASKIDNPADAAEFLKTL